MDQAHARALGALQPFIIILTTTKEPTARFIADNIGRATSAPGTYVFTELLQTPAVQSLSSADTSAEYRAWLTHLEIFSYGTYEEYQSTPNLPPLTEAQSTKLRQLTLITIASSPNTPLTYANLLKALSLPTAASLETLITSSIYSSLLTARLSPTSTPPTVHITSVAPLRDLRPLSLPHLLSILSTWSSRCDSVINSLETQISSIKFTASQRQISQKRKQDIVDAAVTDTGAKLGDTNDGAGGRSLRPRNTKGGTKRDLDETRDDEDEYEEFEDGSGGDELGNGNGGTKMDIDSDPTVPLGGNAASVIGSGLTRGNKKSRGKGHS